MREIVHIYLVIELEKLTKALILTYMYTYCKSGMHFHFLVQNLF